MAVLLEKVEEAAMLLEVSAFQVEDGVDFEPQFDGSFDGDRWVSKKDQAKASNGQFLWKLAVRKLERTSSGRVRRVDDVLVVAAAACPSVLEVTGVVDL